ncbi:MAG: HAMP domain-containing sensor histidine kinase [Planctomycetota bacterium]
MSYQSFKRFVGETNLERKCRWWFGIALVVLLGLSFYGASESMKRVVEKTDRKLGPELVRAWWLEAHSNIEWYYDHRDKIRGDKPLDPNADESARFYSDFLESYQSLGLEFDAYVILPQDPRIDPQRAHPPQYDFEVAFLEAALAEGQRRRESPPATSDEPATPMSLADEPSADGKEVLPLPPGHSEQVVSGEYRYYHPIYAEASCIDCHRALGTRTTPARMDLFEGDLMALVRVEIDRAGTKKLFDNQNARLLVVVVVIGMLSMFLLYFLVRYVIVKPLQHLRDVANAVREGDVDQRAEIKTGDEFEELAAAFNRMLRRLLRQQDALQEVNGELDSKVDQLAQANLRLFEMNRVKSDFLATMSHELRTPLNSILGFSDVLSTIDSLDDKQQRYVGNIQRSGRVLLEMINDILDLAKMESGKMDVRPTEFRIEQVVGAQCDMARPLSERKNIDLECHCPEGLPSLRQDQAKLQQVVNNLLSNAIKFTPEGGRITVTAEREEPAAPGDAMLRLTVQDTGIGIGEDEQQLVFEKFRQGAAAAPGGGVMTREQSGAGLGLSIVRELCRLLGGDVTLDSTVGKGSTFVVTLPWTLSISKNLDAEMRRNVAELTASGSVG